MLTFTFYECLYINLFRNYLTVNNANDLLQTITNKFSFVPTFFMYLQQTIDIQRIILGNN